MKKFRVVNKPLFLQSGIVELTQEQYEARRNMLRPLGGGLYDIVAEVCFKTGEEIGYSAEIPVEVRVVPAALEPMA